MRTNSLTKQQFIGEQSEIYPSKYSFISFQLRSQLIRLVQVDHYSVYKASRLLNIKNSTAKVIIRQYRRNGHIFRRKNQQEASNKSQNGEEALQKINESEHVENQVQQYQYWSFLPIQQMVCGVSLLILFEPRFCQIY